MKGVPSAPLNLEFITTEPVASTTTMNVPATSAINLF